MEYSIAKNGLDSSKQKCKQTKSSEVMKNKTKQQECLRDTRLKQTK